MNSSANACHLAALSAASAAPANNSALALLLYSACSKSGGGAKNYFEHAWRPEQPPCTSTTRFGPEGEGGKVVCDAENRRRGLANRHCLVVSVGLNDDTRAEQAIFRSHPHCEIEGHDGTLTAAKRRLLPREGLVYIPHNLNKSSYKRYEGRVVSLLKIDCEVSHTATAPTAQPPSFPARLLSSLLKPSPSLTCALACVCVHGTAQGCEFSLLAPWLDHVCTEQITLEVHGCPRMRYLLGPSHVRLSKAHALLLRLDREFKIFHREPNPRFPDGCLEYSLQRRRPCPVSRIART